MAAEIILGLTLIMSAIGFNKPVVIQYNLFRPYWFLRKRQYWTLISSGFVHADVGHLLFNLLTFYFFAFRLQQAIGPSRFTALYLIALVLSNTGTYLKRRGEPEYACLGASGAILAVMFAEIVYFPTSRIAFLFLPIPIPAPLFAVLYLAYTIYSARQATDRINHDAHLDGALTGLIFVGLTDWPAWLRAWHVILG
ncbi:MAG TPA: rhomboid family intramembrane serine protease [Steroidobacteraceae bacterium]|jgi:membrane associated rhomboid family serine protease|nr:rhomboid family intramembrane serine protease [Steroidobacteraceae bacterium]